MWAGLLLFWAVQPGWITNKILPKEYLHPFAHVISYAIFAYLMSFYLRFGRRVASYRMTDFKIFALVIAACLMWGGATEWLQHYIPERVPDLLDVLWDSIGATAGSLCFTVRHRLRHRRK